MPLDKAVRAVDVQELERVMPMVLGHIADVCQTVYRSADLTLRAAIKALDQ